MEDLGKIEVQNGYVALEEVMGSDVTVADVARVSFNKRTALNKDGTLKNGDKKLIKYLAEHGHTSPFRHQFLRFRVEAPIFVLRQWGKHQVGCAWNEVSGRYVEFKPKFWKVDAFRGKPTENAKQGSGEELLPIEEAYCQGIYQKANEAAFEAYQTLIKIGSCNEQARMVLPACLMTEFVWSCSLQACAHFLKQRLDSHAQREIQMFAEAVYNLAKPYFTESLNNLVQVNNNG